MTKNHPLLFAAIQTVSSTLLRAAVYIFLRLFPTQYGRFVIPALYSLYFTSWALGELFKRPVSPSSIVAVIDEIDVVTARKEKPTEDNEAGTDEKEKAAGEEGTSVEKAPEAEVDAKEPPIESVIVQEQVTVVTVAETQDAYSAPFTSILFTLPRASRLLRFVSLLINTALLLMTIDFLIRPLYQTYEDVTFARVGAVDHSSAKILVRYPGSEDPVKILWRQAPKTFVPNGIDEQVVLDSEVGWNEGPVLTLTKENDYVGVGKITNLWPSTSYEYRLASPETGFLPYPSHPLPFKTFPDPRMSTGHRFRFVASSCVLPNFPYVPFTPPTRIRGFKLLANQLWPPVSHSHTQKLASKLAAQVSQAAATLSPAAPVTPEEPSPKESTHSKTSSQVPAEPTPEAGPITGLDSPAAGTSATSPDASSTGTTDTPISVSRPETTVQPPAPAEFLVLLGDFIYWSIPLKHGDTAEAYKRLYRQNYASKEFRSVYERLPMYSIYDDHEIANNFVGNSDDLKPPFPNASHAYNLYTAQANPEPKVPGSNYYDFVYGDTAFFVMDTRRYRTPAEVHLAAAANGTDEVKATMLGDTQLKALYEWAGKVNQTSTFKFIVSSVPFSSMWGGPSGQTDTWAGYQAERRAILDLLYYIPNVIIISGDRHEFAAIEHFGGILEFSTSPLNQFYFPLVRTLKQKLAKVREVKVGSGEEVKILKVPEEKILKYIAVGNHKWSSFEVDTTNLQKPTVKVEVTIDGRPAWTFNILGRATSLSPTKALGQQLTDKLKNLFGFLPRFA